MLQQREISRVLSQAVGGNSQAASNAGQIHASALLSAKGLPLITVTAPRTDENASSTVSDDLRMYSLMAANMFKQQEKTGDEVLDSWAVLDLDTRLKVMVKQFLTSTGEQSRPEAMFVAFFYSADYPDIEAKARVDSLVDTFASGLAGYSSA